jgi:hypothetical protein
MQILLVLTFLGGQSHASKQKKSKTLRYFLGNESNEPYSYKRKGIYLQGSHQIALTKVKKNFLH